MNKIIMRLKKWSHLAGVFLLMVFFSSNLQSKAVYYEDSGSGQALCQTKAFLAESDNVLLTTSIEFENFMLTESCCDNGKPRGITLLYNGKNCGSSSNSQSSSKWSCSDVNGGPNNKATVYIKASSDANGSGTIYFAGSVNLNGTFTADAANAGQSKLPSDTYLTIYTGQNGTQLQRVKIHTSCSAPLVPGETFGSLQLKSVIFENGSTCPAAPPVPNEVCPTPVIIPPTGQICKGQPATFSAVDLGYPCLTYAWNFGTNATPSVASGLGPHTVVFSNSGTVSVSLSIDNGCSGGSGGSGSGSSGSSGSGSTGSGSSGSGSNGSGSSGSSGSNGSGSNGGGGVICGGSNGSSGSSGSGSSGSGSNGSGSTGSGSNGSGSTGSGSSGSGSSGSGSNGSSNPCGGTVGSGSNGSGSSGSGSSGSGSTGSGSSGSGSSGSGSTGSGSNGSGSSGSGSSGDGCPCVECRLTTTVTIQVDNCQAGNTGKIGDFVWRDNNGNGIQDNNEPGISGAWVMLTKCNGDYVNGMLTDANGMYMFSNLPGGSYKVRFVSNNATLMASPTNATNDKTKDSDAGSDGWTSCFTLGDGETNLTIDAGFKPMVTPACSVNIGITNILCDGKGTPQTTDDTYTFVLNVTGTGTSAQWSGGFSNAYLGAFAIAPTAYGTPVTLGPFPAGQFTAGNTNPPITVQNGLNIDVSVNDVQNTSCKNSTVVVSPGPCSPGATASIGDFVWNDIDKNGLQGPNEPGVQGVVVRLLKCDGSFVSQTTTNANGIYGFSGLAPNMQYKLEFTNLPSGFQFTSQDAGNDGLDSDVNPATGMTTCTLLTPGENDNTWDAGVFDATPPGSIGNFVWDDKNKNGLQDPNEPGVGGVTVKLFTCNGVFITQTTTNNNGLYLFSNVTANQSYFVEFSNLPAGFQFTTKDAGNDNIDSDANPGNGRTDCFPLAQGQNDQTRDAGIFQSTPSGPGKIGDFVWFDTNGNGIQDPNEPGIPNIFVILETCSGTFVNFAITGPNGMYMFNNVQPGSYRVKFANPGTYNGVPIQLTIQNAGNNDAKDSDANWLGFTDCFSIGQGETNLTIDAGFRGETPPQICVINGSVSNIICSDNGTPNNPNDDTYKFTLVVNGSNTGDWGFDIQQTGQIMLGYGTPHVIGPFPISAGPLTLNICDHDVLGCCTTVSVTPPQPCSIGGPICNNVTNGGSIGYDESNCGSFDPAAIVSLTLPSGGSGAIEYIWLKSTSGCPDNVSQAIPGATGASYDPPSISVTTWYVRLARRAGCTQWVPSNCVKKEVKTDCGTGCPIAISTSPNTITISGLNAPNVLVTVFNSQWQTVFNCFNNCNNPQVIGSLPAGIYYVKVQISDAAWKLICKEEKYYTVPGTNIVIPGNPNGGSNAETSGAGHAEKGPDANVTAGALLSDRNGGAGDETVVEPFGAILFPNPANGSVTVTWIQAEAGQKMEITLMNQLGQSVKTVSLYDASAGSYNIDLTDLRDGQYIVFIKLEGKTPVVKKLMVTR